MTDKIGELADKVKTYLDERGEVSYATLRREVVGKTFPMPDVALSSALGWLARNRQIHLMETGTGRGYRIRVSALN